MAIKLVQVEDKNAPPLRRKKIKLVPVQDGSAPKETPGTFAGAFGTGVAERALENAMALPRMFAQDVAARFGPPDPQRQQTLRQGISNLAPSGREVLAAMEALSPNTTFPEALESRNQVAEARPFASTAGNVTGDAATLLTGERLISRSPIGDIVRQGAQTLQQTIARTAASKTPSVQRWVANSLQHPAVQSVARGLGRAGQAGIEGATLATLQDGDPVETAALAAGTQAAGSVALQLNKGLFSGGPAAIGTKVFAASLATGSLLAMLDNVSPGEEDSWISLVDVGFDKTTFAMMLGALAGVSGLGRITGNRGKDLPTFAAALTTIPRGSVISILEDRVKDRQEGTDFVKPVIDILSNPDPVVRKNLNKETLKELEEALLDGSKSFRGTVMRLVEEDEGLSDAMSAPDPRLVGVPLRDKRPQ